MGAVKLSLKKLLLLVTLWIIGRLLINRYSTIQVLKETTPGQIATIATPLSTQVLSLLVTTAWFAIVFYIGYTAVKTHEGKIKDCVILGILGSVVGFFGLMVLGNIFFEAWPIEEATKLVTREMLALTRTLQKF